MFYQYINHTHTKHLLGRWITFYRYNSYQKLRNECKKKREENITERRVSIVGNKRVFSKPYTIKTKKY